MSQNLREIFIKAANSNLTPTALEFVPRSSSVTSYSSQPSSSNMENNHKNRNENNHFRRNQQNQYEQTNSSENKTYNKKSDNRDRCLNRANYYERHESRNSYHDRYDRRNYRDRREERSNNDRKENSTAFSNSTQKNVFPANKHFYVNNNDDNEKRMNIREYETVSNTDVVHNGRRDSDNRDFRRYRSDNSNNKQVKPNEEFDPDDIEYNEHSRRNFMFENRHYKMSNNANQRKIRNNYIKSSDEKNKDAVKIKNSISQRERLIEQLNKGTLECLVCCESIKQREPVWNCNNCYHVLHMWCVIKWAKSSKNENDNWRCPACQHEKVEIPEKYVCFCGKTKLQTEWNRQDTAHSCGEVCGRSKENPTPWFLCEHSCTLLCHPGPCPACVIQVTRECGCGRTRKTVQCSIKSEILCGAICDRLLNCGVHRCPKPCHFGECDTCVDKINFSCYCGKKSKKITCGMEGIEAKFSCNEKCEHILNCGNHKCSYICHPGECDLCPRSPTVLDSCSCGKTRLLENSRNSCLDPIPTCNQICGKRLNCGPKNKPHTCELLCHEDECGTCTKQTVMKCRCGALEKSIPCTEIKNAATFKCQKKCSKKRSCGKHKCNQICCIDVEHICRQRCSGTMNCGKHRCEMLCHRGKCGRCLQSSFEELYCHCGHSVIYPPVPCGTKPPACDRPCQRQHDCEHPPLHTCHSDRTCPPCIVFTDKLCYGGHELRKTIPCYQKEFSCGLPCGKPLPCGFHKCIVPCHGGDCFTADKKCTQPCTKNRNLCGHFCAAPCHTGLCPDTPCRETVKVTCACGNLVDNHYCYEHADDYRRIISATLATKMGELQMGNSVNINDVDDKINAEKINLRTLECSDECKLIMRNRRLALALQIQNPDMSAKLTPRYSDFMKSWAKKDSALCRHVHDKLTALVKLAKESKQKSRSFSFDVMNKEKRQFVHEYCAHFGCESEAYDAEPKRNVVAIATKGRCWLPAYSVVEVVQREMGQRKVPVPVINKKITSNSRNESNCYALPKTIILPVLPSACSSHSGMNYFGD